MTPEQLAKKFYEDMRQAAYDWWYENEHELGGMHVNTTAHSSVSAVEEAFAVNGSEFGFIMTHPWKIEDELIQDAIENGTYDQEDIVTL